MKYVYQVDKKISDEYGSPKDSTVNFFPKALLYNDSLLNIGSSTWYSPNLHIAKEKILYNRYLGQDSYRFSWFRSFDGPVFITINRKEANYWLTIKKLSKPYVKYQYVIKFIPPNVSKEETKKNLQEHEQMMDTLRLPPKIVIDRQKSITRSEWNESESLLKTCDYWNLQPMDPGLTKIDGSHWIIEAHFKDKYWFVDRWSPRDNFKFCGEYLLQLSGLEEEIY